MEKRFEKQNKYAIKKKKGGGGAASVFIGSILLGSLFVSAPIIMADDNSSTSVASTAQPSTSTGQIANEKFEITSVTLSKNVVKESEGFDIDIDIDWDATNLRKGDILELDLPEEFDSIEKVVTQKVKDSQLGDFGILTLDYTNHKIRFEITCDVNYYRPYFGNLTIGTFVNRNFYQKYNNPSKPVVFNTPSGTFKPELAVVWNTLQADNDQMMTLATDTNQNKVSWMTAIHTDRISGGLHDAVIYLLNKDDVNDIKFGSNRQGDSVINKLVTSPIDNGYNLDLDSIKVYEATINDSFSYSKGKELKRGESLDEGIDYYIAKSQVAPDAKEIWAVVFVGDYANTTKQLVVEYSGTVENQGSLQSAALLTTYSTAYNELTQNHPKGTLDPIYSGANVFVNDSEATMKVDETKGTVVVVHVDKETGKILKYEYVAKNELVDSPYHTSPETFEGYKFIEKDPSTAPSDGKVESGVQVVVYYYSPEKQKGNVDVTYKTVEGDVLSDTEDVFTEDKEVGTPYNTTQKSFQGYHFVKLSDDSAPTDGTVTAAKQHVIYLYEKDVVPEEKKGSVDVKYITKDGKVLEDVTSVKDNAPVGEDYTTEEKSFEGYHFVGMDKSSYPATGVVAEGTKHVIYVYEKDVTPEVKKGNVDVTYIAEDGTVLEATSDVVKDGEIGSSYETTQKSFDGYTFKRMGEFSADATGQVEEGTKHVVYVYAKNSETPEEKKGSVDVKYITKDGKVLEDVTSVKDNAPVGEDYATEEKTFEGYHFVGMDKTSDPATGVVAEGTKHVIYVYEKDVTPEVKKGNVDVTYVAEDGTVLEATSDVVKDGEIGSSYETTQKSFDGYTFKRMGEFSADATGQVEEGTKHVVYVYAKNPETPEEKKGNVDVTYIAEDGTVLEATSDVVKDGEIGSSYETTQKSFDGYTFKRMGEFSADATGQVEEGTKHVVYVYAKNPETPEVKKGNVDVTYVAEDGTVLEATSDVVKDGEIGSSYETTQKSFDGYTFKRMGEFSADATGQVEEGTKHVVYVYAKNSETPEEKKGSVDVKYITKDGKVLEDVTSVKDNAPVGEDYTTEEKTFEGYHFVGMDKSSDPATGVVAEGTKHVIYVYEKDVTPEVKKGNVDVTYIAEDGTVLEATSDVVKDGEIGSSYETTQKSFDGYTFKRMGEFSADATGQVEEGTKHVVYVYAKNPETSEEKKGSVDVKYITKDGKVLEDVTSVKDNAPVGEDYTTEEKSFEGYHFVGMDKTSDPATGVVAEGTKHVIYVYEKDVTPEVKKGNVDVTYIAEDGTVLEATSDVVKDGEIGSSYETTQKSFDGYTFKRMGEFSADATGQVEEGTKHVVYVYAKKPETSEEKKGSVDVKYITKDGKVLEDVTSVKDNAPVGEDYTTEEKTFEGYHFVGMDKSSDPATGVVAEGTKHVIYVYEKDVTPEVKKGNVDVTYIAEDGTVLEATSDVVKDGEIGSSYETTQKSFDGYTFKRMGEFSADATGQVEEGTKHVVYVYAKKPETPEEKKGSVDVKYITKDGEVLEDVTSVKENAPVGEDYATEEKSFEGYHFVGMDKTSDPATGVVAEGTKHVIYVYEKDVMPEEKKGSVDVKYITKDGKVLEDVTSVKENAPVGEDYTTEEKSFKGYHFVGMDKTSDPATGVVAEGSKHVIYVYEKDVTPEVKKGNVDVTYIAEDGTVLEATSDVVKDGEIGSGYATTQKSFDGYTFKRMGEFSADVTGQVEEGTKHVVYVYAKNPETPEEKKGSVDVKYITKDGKVLEDVTSVKENAPVGEDYATEEKSFEGYHFVGMDKTSDPATGVVAEGSKHVIYVYEKDVTPEEKKGSVDVKYITKDGEVLEDVTSVKENVPVGEDYATVLQSFDGYHFVGMDKTSNPATGVVAEGTKHVIYVYEKDVTPEEKKGSVDVKYITKDGKVLEDVTSVKENAPVGEDYATEEKSFEGYHFVGMDKTSNPATGVVAEGTKHVIYVYEKDVTPEVKKGNVDVTYIAEDGTILEATSDVVKDGEIGSSYATTQKSFDGYTFKRMGEFSADVTGQVEEGTKHVIYVYAKNPETPEVKKGSVTVIYVDKFGNPLPGGNKVTIKDNVPAGEDYTTELKSFDGYRFVGMDKNSNPASGKVAEGTKEVIYVYEKIPVSPEKDNNHKKESNVSPKVVEDTKETSTKAKTQLPKAGMSNKSGNTFLGLASVSVAGLLGLMSKRRREENE